MASTRKTKIELTEQSPVLVVGGRTTGMTMAAELVRHGVPVRIIDKSPGIDPHARATLIHSRTLEIFQAMGVAGDITALGQPLLRHLLYSNGVLVGVTDDDEVDSPFPYALGLSQANTEAALERHLNKLGVQVERSTWLRDLDQDEQWVTAVIVHADGREETLQTPFLVGCDGAHSTVRHLTEEGGFPGEPDPVPYLVGDVCLHGSIKPGDTLIYLHDEGDLFITPLSEGRHLLVASMASNEINGFAAAEAATPDLMQSIIDQRTMDHFAIEDPRWLQIFKINYRLVPHYRHGRTFLAGDAAHVHSPFGGLGMNTGIQDAWNLAWKIALVWRDIVPDRWLDSYDIERRMAGREALETSRLTTEKLESFTALSESEREKLCRHLFPAAEEKAAARRHAEQLDLDYETSFLCRETPGEFKAGPCAGQQALDVPGLHLGGLEISLYEVLSEPFHHLLVFTGSKAGHILADLSDWARDFAAAHGHWIRVLWVQASRKMPAPPDGAIAVHDPDGLLHQRYDSENGGLYLVRPDGYVACRTRHTGELEKYLLEVTSHRNGIRAG